jgi:hypothetical protein
MKVKSAVGSAVFRCTQLQSGTISSLKPCLSPKAIFDRMQPLPACSHVSALGDLNVLDATPPRHPDFVPSRLPVTLVADVFAAGPGDTMGTLVETQRRG